MDWKNFTEKDWKEYARNWLIKVIDSESENSDTGILILNFMGSAEENWKFIICALELANTDAELGHLAAGPLEHFIGKFGEEYIDRIEELAEKDLKFNRLLTGVWKHLSVNDVWNRIKILQKRITNPLPEYSNE